MDLPGPLAQGNAEIDQLLIRNVMKASKIYKNIMSITKVVKRTILLHGKKWMKVLLVLYTTKHHYLQEVTQRVLKGMKSGR